MAPGTLFFNGTGNLTTKAPTALKIGVANAIQNFFVKKANQLKMLAFVEHFDDDGVLEQELHLHLEDDVERVLLLSQAEDRFP